MCEACANLERRERAELAAEVRRRTGWPVIPASDGSIVRFAFFDHEGLVETVRLRHGIAGHRTPPCFVNRGDGLFTLEFHAGDAVRVEYMFELSGAGRTRTIHDPLNPLQADGPYGGKSVVLRDGCAEALCVSEPIATHRGELIFRAANLGGPGDVDGARELAIWQPAGASADDELPLVLFLDGIDYLRLGRMQWVLENTIGWGWMPACRAVFIAPLQRDDEYSANPGTPAWLGHVLDSLRTVINVPANREKRIAVGTSLGALCLLHAASVNESLFGGLVLQSGSFFQRDTDRMECGYPWFERITNAVSHVLSRGLGNAPPRISATCGTAEENIRNNDVMMSRLQERGVNVVRYQRVRDAHNWTAWRNCIGEALMNVMREGM